MRISSGLPILLLTTLFVPICRAESRSELSLTHDAVAKIRGQFETLRLDENDFRLYPPKWDMPFTISGIERFFEKPLEIPINATAWSDQIESARLASDLLESARGILGVSLVSNRKDFPLKTKIPPSVPKEIQPALTTLLQGIAGAQPHLNRAVDSTSSTARQGFLALNEWPNSETGVVIQEISARRTKQRYEGMKKFSETELHTAALILFSHFDRAMAAFPPNLPLEKQLRFKTPQGWVVISGPADDVYEKDDLKEVVLLIDLGGKNIYRTPVAVAHEKEIRVVIDWGSDLQISGESELHGNAGAGVFGIGLLALPNAAGVKEIHTGSFSQGFGLGGVGALLIKGTAHLTAERSVQGMGVFGVGILSAKNADKSTYVATRSGQGSAFTRGVGIFLHEGNQADIKGGLVQPDPREPLGSVSMCQGVGFGPRAYAGGGVGIAVVKGDNNSVKGSYFSQGVGYWHGMGVFRLRGNKNTTQARRYDMGSGVHYAFGHMDVFGDQNRILNWGVGPSYGWDHSIGSSLISGNDNEMQTEWGSGTASIGSLSFSLIRGQRNKLKLCNHASNSFFRDEASYSIQILDGSENQMECQGIANTNSKKLPRMTTPWGLMEIEGVRFVDKLGLVPPEWLDLPREKEAQRSMVDLQSSLRQAMTKSPSEQVSDLVDVAAAFSLDKASPRQAMRAMILLPPEKAPLLIESIEPVAVDQLIQLSVAIPAHGDVTARVLLAKSKTNSSLQKRATFINLLRMSRPSLTLPILLEMTQQTIPLDLKISILRTMAQLLNKDNGNEPGSRAIFSALLDAFQNPEKKEAAITLLQRVRLSDGFGLLASSTQLTPVQRGEFLDNAPDDITGTLAEKGAKAFLKIIDERKEENLQIIAAQEKILNEMEPLVRRQLADLLQSTRAAVVNSAVIGLGQIANPNDTLLFEPLLEHSNTRVRESAAVALGRMGETGVPILQRALSSNNLRTRRLVLVAITQATHAKIFSLVPLALGDADATVRLTTLAAIENLPESFSKEREKIKTEAKNILSKETDPAVCLARDLLR